MIEKSFFLVRTNPALTGNVKLVVSSSYKLYLESFDVNKDLSQERLKHYEIKKDEYYKEVLPYFFKDIEARNIFEVKDDNDASNMYNEYQYQFDDKYYSGAFFSEDTWYKEEYEYLAPLYIKNNKLPKNFIILRVDGAGQLSEESNGSNFRTNIINNWKFVSMFDLTPKSDLGVWMNKNYVEDNIPKHPLLIKHNSELTEVYGIDLEYGGWATRYLDLSETQSQNTPIFKTEEFITNLWQDNNIIYPHIINLKFLFDDTPATHDSLKPYSQNRYTGFYLDDAAVVKKTTPYQGVELNKPTILHDILADEVSEIPYVVNNYFVRDVNGRRYSFDPIKKGWDNKQTYWVEFESDFYRLERVENKDANIIGKHLYRIVSNKNIEFTINLLPSGKTTRIQRLSNGIIIDEYEASTPKGVVDAKILSEIKKVLITDISINRNEITIGSVGDFNNIIENTNTFVIQPVRRYDWYKINGVMTFTFRIDVVDMVDAFEIADFDEADLHLMKIGEDYHVIKKFADNIPVVGGKYYLHTDWMINVSGKSITSWINNGNTTHNPLYYKYVNLENISYDQTPPIFDVVRANFTDIQDFDFDRVDTEYTRYEYEKTNEIEPTTHVEPKLYAKEHREVSIKVRTIPAEKAIRIPILDINNRPYYFRKAEGLLNTFTKTAYTDSELFRTDFDGSWMLFDGIADGVEWKGYRDKFISLKRNYIREENYILRTQDSQIDFTPTSVPKVITENISWVDGKPEGLKTNEALKSLQINQVNDPNEVFDMNYIPVSSEYIASDELWEIRNNNLTKIWAKNQSICKWGFINSVGLHDYPYRLNYSFDIGGTFNREPNIFSGQDTPIRKHFDLDYFYRFGIANPTDYEFYSLHLKGDTLDQVNGFNVDKYVSSEFDYFEYLFKSDQETSKGIKLTNKYSKFLSENEFGDVYTLFRGVKYKLSDVQEIIKTVQGNDVVIDNILTKNNNKYDDYSFSVVFSRKPSAFIFNSGTGSINSGIDIYLNDVWKNVVVHLYIDTNDVIEHQDSNGVIINAETCKIDAWYEDTVLTRDINTNEWDRTGFKIGGLDISIRPRDFMLSKFLYTLNNFNYIPTDNKNAINFIHIYDDGREPKIMSYNDTDFLLIAELPNEVLAQENVYKTLPIGNTSSLLNINNSFKNRVLVENNTNFISDINVYNNYPIGRQIVLESDIRPYWNLSDIADPSFFRYDGVYAPIFKNIPLFRPMGYNTLTKQSQVSKLKSGNWKFYDSGSNNDSPNLNGFGMLSEVIYSKVNPASNVLKIQDSLGIDKSIYPMIDEFGYDFDARYLFASTWDSNFHSLSRRVEIESNPLTGHADYAVEFDGFKDYLAISDKPKFNLEKFLIDESNFYNNINIEPEGERSFYRKTLIGITSSGRSFDFKLLANMQYNLSLTFHNYVATQTGETFKCVIELLSETGNTELIKFENIVVNNKTTITNTFTTAVTSDNIIGNIINAKITLSFMGTTTSVVDVYPLTLDLVNRKNFIDFDVDVDKHSIWGGLMRKNDGTQVGDITSYPFKIDNVPFIDPVSLTVNSLLLKNHLSDSLKEFGYSVDESTLENNTNEYYRLFNLDGFSFEPDNWSNIENGKSITYVGKKEGNALLTPKRTLKWFTSYKDAKAPIISVPIHKYEPEPDIEEELPFPVKRRPYVPGIIAADIPIDNSTSKGYVDSNFDDIYNNQVEQVTGGSRAIVNNDLRSYGDTNYQIGLHDIVDNYRATTPVDDTDITPKFIQPLGKIVFVPTTNFLPVPLPTPKPIVDKTIDIIKDAGNTVPNTIEFRIVPENGTPMKVSIPSRHPVDGSPLPLHDILGLINEQITPNYIVTYTKEDNDEERNYKLLEIVSAYAGSFYNFKIEVLNSHLELYDTGIDIATDEVTLSEKFTKTSLRQERITGHIGGYTIEFQIKVGAWNKEYETIFYKGANTSKDVWLDNFFNDYTLVIGRDRVTNGIAFKTCHRKINGEFEHHILSSNVALNDNKWHHVACVVDVNNRKKEIYIDNVLSAVAADFILPSYVNISSKELVALFLKNKNRFAPGLENTVFTKAFPSDSDILGDVYTPNTQYWYDVIRGYSQPSVWEKEAMDMNMSVTIDIAYRAFQENLTELDYYMNAAQSDDDWFIFLGTDSAITLGKRTFNGALDELRIWNYARTKSQIVNTSRFILRPESYLDPLNSLVSYYRFNEGIGTNVIRDYMDGKFISELDKWCRVRTKYINNGFREYERDEIRYFMFEKQFHAGAHIESNIENITWVISGANILGFSDERYVIQAPPITKEQYTDVEKPIFAKTKHVMEKKNNPDSNIKKHILDVTKVHVDKDFTRLTWYQRMMLSKNKWKFGMTTPLNPNAKAIVSLKKKSFIDKIFNLFRKKK
jgi:hypothetical protein